MDKLSDKYKTGLVVVLLAVATLAVYWQVQNHNFIDFDDDLYVTDNDNVQAGLTWKGIKWAFTTKPTIGILLYGYHTCWIASFMA